LDGDDALSGSRYALLDRHRGRNARAKSEPPQPSRREHEHVVVAGIELTQSRIEIPANVQKLSVRKTLLQLCDPPNAAGADTGHFRLWALGSRLRAGQHQHIPRILPLENGTYFESIGQQR